ncbi:hypothetical protein JS278_02777 [Acidipropionibacterium virtanenii]|uniref:Uncharacterized protein n=1 Tax=Acidipropionibacterium virtanenii TaxID=2057246 RepID=A0A344UXB4_9ACTN|nr:hypothetical protein JS278_02777 [Acidipropionibacterium virtanenii]
MGMAMGLFGGGVALVVLILAVLGMTGVIG